VTGGVCAGEEGLLPPRDGDGTAAAGRSMTQRDSFTHHGCTMHSSVA